MTTAPQAENTTPHLVLVTEVVLDTYTDTLGRTRARRRTRVGHTRPGLPADPANEWTRTVTTWADHLHGRLSQTEHPNYVKRVGWLAGDHPEASPWSLTTDDLAAWLDRQPWSLSTRRSVIVAVRNFYAWAVRAGLCDASPLAGVSVTAPRAPGPRRTELPEAWSQPVADWLTWLRAGARTESTVRTRRDHLFHLAQLHADPWAVTEGDLSRWLSRSDWTPATKRSKRATARSFYAWAHRLGHIGTDPAGDLDPVRQRRALPRPAPDHVLRDALAVADDRVTLALSLALYAGLRRAEIAGLHTRDIHEAFVHVVGKGGHERLVPLHPDLAALLHAELRRRRDATDPGIGWPSPPAADGWLFPSTDSTRHLSPRWLGRLVGRSMAPGWTTHTIRHRFATQAYATQRDLRAVQELLGHSKPETTARYAAVPDGALLAAVAGVRLGLSPAPPD